MPDVIVRQQDHWRGYRVVWLRKPGLHKEMFAYRLVASAFIPNPGNKPLVNHKDGNKEHNDVSNLEWADWSENTTHFYAGRARMEEKNAF